MTSRVHKASAVLDELGNELPCKERGDGASSNDSTNDESDPEAASSGNSSKGGASSSLSSRCFDTSYEILGPDPLALGQYASVWRCKCRGGSDIRAAKRLELGMLLENERRQVLGEDGQLGFLKQLRHPHIVRFYEAFQQGQSLLLILELCGGGDLMQLVTGRWHERHAGLGEWEAATAFRHLLLALAFVHDRRILHRDVKAENVLELAPVDSLQEATFKLCDFGCAARLENGRALRERVGSPMYMAPEVRDRKSYGTPIDLWSTGVLLQTVILGHLAADAAQAPSAVAEALAADSWARLGRAASRLLEELLDEDPDGRPAASEVLALAWLQEDALHTFQDAAEEDGLSMLLEAFRQWWQACARRLRTSTTTDAEASSFTKKAD